VNTSSHVDQPAPALRGGARGRNRDRACTLAVCTLALAIASGCGRREEEAPPQTEPAPAAPVEAEPTPSAPPPPYQDPPAWRQARARELQDDPGRAILEPKAQETQKPRDFSAELERMLNGANTCLQPRPRDNSSAISVSFTAHVMPSGIVSRGEVDASGLQEEERACLRARLQALQFGPPIENAPLSVMATLQITPKTIAAPKQDAPKTDALGMTVTQTPSGEGVTPGIVPREDPGVVPPETPGLVPPADPGVAIQADPGVIPTPDAPAEVLPVPEPSQR
jgi:hypothetical protein